jgi:flagellar hook-basal body complex protein FliE
MSEIGIRSQSYSSMLQKQLLGTDAPSVSASKPESARGTQASEGGGSFADTLKQAMETTNEIQIQADEASKDFAAGKGNLHETMIAMEKADVSLRTLTAVRGKLVEAYQEIMRMPV